jgi:membrane fusion protein (multidrug efflux system)
MNSETALLDPRERDASAPINPNGTAGAQGSRRLLTRGLELLLAAAVIVLLASVALPVGWSWWVDGGRLETTDDAYVTGDLRTLGAKVPGYVTKLLVADFETVSAGQPILQIEDDDYRAKVALAAGVVRSKQAALDNIAALERQQQNVIEQASAQVDSTAANLELASLQLERARALLRTPAGLQQTFDQTTATYKALVASLQANRAGLAQAKGQLSVLAAQREQALGDLAQAQASLQLANIDLEHTVIRAPVAGKLGKRSVFEGQYLAAGAGVVTLTPLDSIWVVANFRETQLAHMLPGQAVSLTVDSYPGLTVRGHVGALSPSSGAATALLPPDNATGNFTKIVQRVPVKVTIDDKQLEGRLLPGLSCVVTVDTGSASDTTPKDPAR